MKKYIIEVETWGSTPKEVEEELRKALYAIDSTIYVLEVEEANK